MLIYNIFSYNKTFTDRTIGFSTKLLIATQRYVNTRKATSHLFAIHLHKHCKCEKQQNSNFILQTQIYDNIKNREQAKRKKTPARNTQTSEHKKNKAAQSATLFISETQLRNRFISF